MTEAPIRELQEELDRQRVRLARRQPGESTWQLRDDHLMGLIVVGAGIISFLFVTGFFDGIRTDISTTILAWASGTFLITLTAIGVLAVGAALWDGRTVWTGLLSVLVTIGACVC